MVSARLQHAILARGNSQAGDLLHLAVSVDLVQLVLRTVNVALHLGDGDVLVGGVVQSAKHRRHVLACRLGGDIGIVELQSLLVRSLVVGGISGLSGLSSLRRGGSVVLIFPIVRACRKEQRTAQRNDSRGCGTLLGVVQGGQGHNKPFN